MKKRLIGAFIGGILLFAWQSISWMFLPYHEEAFQRVSNQDSVIQAIASMFPQEGQYMIPQAAAGSSQEEAAKFMEAQAGKPWAMVTFHRAMKTDMTGAMTRGFLIAVFTSLLVGWIIQRKEKSSFSDGFITSLLTGLVCFFYVWYNNHNWFETPWSVLRGEAYDLIIAWSLHGIWAGWWYHRA